jgi:predicted alpha/beta-hydrolase family hydrolase
MSLAQRRLASVILTAMDPIAFDVPAESGTPHQARLYRTEENNSRRALLVLAHGAGAGQSHPFMVRYARGLSERGIDVVTFDFPYITATRHSPDRAPVLEAAFRAVVAASAARKDIRPSNVFIGGKSMGGRMATHLAASPEDWPAGIPALGGVVVFGYPLNPPGGPSKRSPDRVSHFARITVPALIVQGTRDNFGGPPQIRTAFPHAQVFEVPTGDHSFSVQKSAGRSPPQMVAVIIDAVVAFMTALGRGRPRPYST